MTVLELIERSSARLDQAGVSFGQGTTNAFDEAAWLVLWRLGLPLDDLAGVAERPVPAADRLSVEALIGERITTRKPAAYLTGEAWLQGVPFQVDERTIVPRSLIAEVLANGVLDAWLPREPRRVLDLCTGNGSLAVLAAMTWPRCRVDAADVSTDALAVAQRNVNRHRLAERITLVSSDGFAALELSIRPEQVTPILRRLTQHTQVRARIYGRDGSPIVDSASFLLPGQIKKGELKSDPDSKPKDFWTRLTQWLIDKDLPEMPCRELVEVVTDYLEGRLSPLDRARFGEHLVACDACRTYLEQFRETVRALGRLPEESLSPEARNALLAAFRGWSHR